MLILSNMKQMPYKIEPGAVERAKMRSRAAIYAADSRRRAMRPVRLALGIAASLALLVVVGDYLHSKESQVEVDTVESDAMEQLLAEMRNAPIEVLYDMTLDSSLYVEEGDAMNDLL